MKDIITRLLVSEKERAKRYTEFYDFLKDVITTFPPQILSRLQPLKAARYMTILGEEKPDIFTIDFDLEDLWFWEDYKDRVILKKSGLSRLREDLKVALKVLGLRMEGYLDEE